MSLLKYLVIHCTDTSEGREVTSAEIRAWHTDPKPRGNGWKQVGYQRMYHINGGVEELVRNNYDNFIDPWEITNGVAGRNGEAIHWVYVGGTTNDGLGEPKDTRNYLQRKAMERDLKFFHMKFPNVLIVGHHYFNRNKACPSFDVQAWLHTIGIKQTL